MNGSDSTPLHRQGMDYGESKDVQKVHAAIQREKQEPRVGLEPLSLWLIGIYALAVFFGGAYLGRFSGSFSGDSLDPGTVPTRSHGPGPGGGGQQQQQELTPAERGKKVFMANCAVCHQASGLGSQSQGYPPLAGSEITNGGSRRADRITTAKHTWRSTAQALIVIPSEVEGSRCATLKLSWRNPSRLRIEQRRGRRLRSG